MLDTNCTCNRSSLFFEFWLHIGMNKIFLFLDVHF
ncbi:unnamed protein product, partial [Linum tenue]